MAPNISTRFSRVTGFDICLLNTKRTVQKSNHHSSENYTPYLEGVHEIRAMSSKGSALKHSIFKKDYDYLKHIYIAMQIPRFLLCYFKNVFQVKH